MGSRNEITFSTFDESTGISKEITLPRMTRVNDVIDEFRSFLKAIGYSEAVIDATIRQQARLRP